MRIINHIKTSKTNLKLNSALQGLPYWISALLTGLASVGFTLAFKWAGSLPAKMLEQHAFYLLLISPSCSLIAWWLVYRLAPAAAGSGIPQVLAANKLDHSVDNEKIRSLLSLKTALIKVVSALICLIGGGAIGREGPTIQIGASIFHAFGTRFQRYWPNISHHAWIVAGGAAGIAAAFNTPLGGLVFAIEELSTSHFKSI